MEPSSQWSLVLPFVVADVALVFLCLVSTHVINRLSAAKSRTPMSTRVVMAVAVLYLVAYLVVFSISFGYGDARVAVPPALEVSVAVRSFPLLYLSDSIYPLLRATGHWWGDDLNLVLAFAVMNAVLWGVAIAQLARLVARRSAECRTLSLKVCRLKAPAKR